MFADAALRSALDHFGLRQLDDELDEDQPEARRLLVLAVLAGARGVFPLTRHQRRRAGPAHRRGVPFGIRKNAEHHQFSARYELLGRACTMLGILEPLSPAGYRSLFSR